MDPMRRMGALIVSGLCAAVLPASTGAQHAPAGEATLTATSANVSDVGSPVQIHILRWSTDEERAPVVAALNPRPAVAVPAAPEGGLPAGTEANPSAAAGARGGRGAAGRGGRGRGARGGGDAATLTPTAVMAAAIGKAPTLGYIWTNDITGYAIKYAWHVSLPDGGERIILGTDRRLGAYTAAWKPVSATTVTDYEFTLIEIRLNSKGSGEGKASLTTKVMLDQEARTIALDDYGATPAIFQNVKRVAGTPGR
jgi:hypothetical protein